MPELRDNGTEHLEGAIVRLDDVVVILKELGVGFDGVDHGFSFQLEIRPLLLTFVEPLGSVFWDVQLVDILYFFVLE